MPAARPFTGRGTKVAMGKESSWGSAASRTITFRPKETDIEAKATFDTLAHLVATDSDAGLVRGDKIQANERTMGSFQLVAAYQGNGLGMLLEAALGLLASTGTGPYQHTYTMSAATRTTGLSAEIVRGDSGVSDVVTGGVVRSLELSVEPGQPMNVAVEVMFKTATRGAVGSPPALVAAYYVTHSHAGQLGFNSANYNLTKFRARIEIPMGEIQELGSLYISEPPIVDYANVTIEAEVLYKSDVLHTAALAGTDGDVTISFTDGTRTMDITLQNAHLDKESTAISGPNEVRQTLSFKGKSAASKPGFKVVISASTIANGLN